MLGIVLVTHGNLATEFIAAAEHVVGRQPNMIAVCIGEDDDMEKRREDILQAAISVGEGGGTIILTDMFGGTPSNLAISVMDKAKAEVVAGINLPMLIKLAPEQYRRDNDMKTAITAAHEAGKKYINVASWVLSGEQNA